MINIKVFVFNSFQENTFVISVESNNCIIVDPGMSTKEEKEELSNYIEETKLTPVAMINTHCHVDHVLGCKYIKEKYQIPFYIHPDEKMLLERAQDFGDFFGMEVEPPPAADYYLEDNSVYKFGDTELNIIHVPGHSTGSIALYSKPDASIIMGDVLFRGSIGRTDLPGGDYDTLIRGIKQKILVLPREVIAYPGHGPSTTIGDEYDTNPFLN